jgi:hypothetical protein
MKCACRTQSWGPKFRTLGAYVNYSISIGGVERCASNAVAPDIYHNTESMNACPSHSHRSAIGPDNPRLGAKCAIDPAATDQSKLGGRDSWTARWQKRTRREAFDCDDWFGGGIRRGPQSGCGQGSRIAGKQERSSSQVTLQLSPDLEVGGRLRPSREGRWRDTGVPVPRTGGACFGPLGRWEPPA